MSVRMTSTWSPRSNARCSATVKRRTRSEQPLDRGVLGDVEEENGALERCAFGEPRAKEPGLALRHAHRGEDDHELVGASLPGTVACAAICAASSAAGRPKPEKIGSF